MEIRTPDIPTALEPAAELDQLGDEIAELSAHIEAATAHLLDLIREFDARGGWNTGFRSCAAWLAWRVGDRKSTRLNSSHLVISYAVFCLKKKKKKTTF